VSNIVLDANVAIDWFLESNVGNAYSVPAAMLAESGKLRFCVPEHFHIEVARILVIRARSGKDVRGEKWLEAALVALDSSPIDSYAQGINFELLGKLSKAYDLDVPDVPYFHLARMMELPIASRDKKIITACKHWNVLHWQPA